MVSPTRGTAPSSDESRDEQPGAGEWVPRRTDALRGRITPETDSGGRPDDGPGIETRPGSRSPQICGGIPHRMTGRDSERRESVRRLGASEGGECAPARRGGGEVGAREAGWPGSRRRRSGRREPPWQPRPRASKRGNSPRRRVTDRVRLRDDPGGRDRRARTDAARARPGARSRQGSRSSRSVLVGAIGARRPSRAESELSITTGENPARRPGSIGEARSGCH